MKDVVPTDIINYSYNETWADRLDCYDGEEISYDAIGNPTSYRGKAMTWNGRSLETVTEDGVFISYRYDSEGIRTGKIVGNTESEYYYSDGLLSYEKRGNKEFYYSYDSSGNLCRIVYYDDNGSYVTYYVATNIRGDVESIYKYDGSLVASYIYDSWGNIVSVQDAEGNAITDTNHIGHLNPFRYRGYYYDTESGLYYVSSRYYDPEVSRWINADSTDILNVEANSIMHCNLYSYCWNNPVNMVDDSGDLPWFLTAAAVGAISDSVIYLVSYAIRGKRTTWSGLVKAAAGGAISAVAFGAIGRAIRSAINAGKFAKHGIRIINKKYANKAYKLTGKLAEKYGKSIKFNKYGFPNFSKYAKYTKKIKG